MNVRGFNSEGEMTELQVAAQNESLVSISSRFTEAMSTFPSLETENELISIINDIQGNEHANIVRFQCEREIAKCKIIRNEYSEAIPYLIQSLKTDDTRADIWTQLAECAQHTNNANLYRAANSRIKKLRPQLEISTSPPELPNLTVINEEPRFAGYQLQAACWTSYLRLLSEAVTKCPYYILEIVFAQGQIFETHNQVSLDRPIHIRHQPANSFTKQNIVRTLGGKTLLEFFQSMVVMEVNSETWLFSEPVIALCATTLNEISLLPFTTKPVPKDIAKLLIDIGTTYVLNDLTPPTKLFLAELAAEVQPDKCSVLLQGIDSPNLHSQNALLRLSYAVLQESLRKNLDYSIIESQFNACQKNLDQELCLAHAGIIIDKQLLDEKKDQIRILKMISTGSSSDSDAVSLFEDPSKLSFLSLSNIIKLITQFSNESMILVFPKFLKLLPELIYANKNEVDGLSQIFNKIIEPFDKDTINNLMNSFKALNEINADKNLLFSCALALARSSVHYEDKAKLLVRVHKTLGKYSVCCNSNGKFLEYLLDALLERVDEFENDLTSAFTCYFSDVPLCNVNHHSTLKFRCSKYVQPFVNHAYRLDAKGAIQQFVLFTPYLAIWKHWKSGCNCILSIDGWRMYHIIKKKESQLSKSELPEGYDPQGVLEDLLRHDPENRTESRVALGKVLMRSFFNASEPDNSILKEAIQLLSDDNSPPLMLINAIAHALIGDDPHQTIEILSSLPVFAKPKKEARKLYWLIRLMLETNQRERAIDAAKAAFSLKNNLSSDFALYLQSIAADVFQDKKIYKDIISTYCKSRILCPYPFIGLAKLLPLNEAYNVIYSKDYKLVRPESTNITSFFHFDFKPPFLMARPDDLTSIRHDILDIFVNSAAASGNYLKLFGLFNPSMKVDRKASKVLSKNRIIYGVDRLDIFAKYIVELTKVLIQKGDKVKNDLQERAIDALIRGSQVELTDSLKPALQGLFDYMWKRQTGTDPPPEASVNELINMIMGVNEEEDEEEDGDFIDDEDEDDDGDADGKSKPKTKRSRKDDEAIEADGDEDDDDDDEAIEAEGDDDEEDDVEDVEDEEDDNEEGNDDEDDDEGNEDDDNGEDDNAEDE